MTGFCTDKKRLFRAALIAMLVLGVCQWARWRPAQRFDAGTLARHEFRMMTWNAGYFSAAHNKNMRDADIHRIAAVIRESDVSVAVMQELGSSEQADAIAAELGDAWRSCHVGTGHQGQILAVITRLAEREVVERVAGGRRLIGVSLQHGSGVDLFVAGAHSPHPVRGMENTVANIRGAVDMAMERDEQFRVITGDLNYQFNDDDPLYGELLKKMSDGTEAIGNTYYAQTRLDHMFHYPKSVSPVDEESGMIDLSFRLAKVPGFRDHRPVVVTYNLGSIADAQRVAMR